jgi:hypothetical protein
MTEQNFGLFRARLTPPRDTTRRCCRATHGIVPGRNSSLPLKVLQ